MRGMAIAGVLLWACAPGSATIDGQDPFGDPFGGDPSNPDPADPTTDDADPTDPATDDATDPGDEPVAPVEVQIGADGGVLDNGCVEVSVPAGALRFDTRVTISAVDPGQVPSRFEASSKLWRIDVEGEPFLVPAEVSVCFDGDAEGRALLVAPAGQLAAAVTSRRVGDALVGEIQGGGDVFVGRRTLVTDSVSVEAGGLLDLLFVVDNSCSMESKQLTLIDEFPDMVARLDDAVDWRIGVVTTDMEDVRQSGRLRLSDGWKWVQENQANRATIFEEMAMVGVDGSPNEAGRSAAYTALETLKNGYNAGFVREEADLGVIIFSDENDYSTNQPVSQTEFIDWLDAYKGDPLRTTFSAVVAQSNCQVDGDAVTYTELAVATGGTSHDICRSGFARVLDPMVEAAKNRCWALLEPLADGPFEVQVREAGQTRTLAEAEWEYDPVGNCVRPEGEIAAESALITYRPAP